MKPLPPVLIVTDRGHFLAYRSSSDSAPQKIADVQFEEGNQRLSELVTDQAGAFPVAGSSGTSAGENMPLKAELEVRCIRQIASQIEDLLQREDHPLWGLAAPAEISGAILDILDKKAASKLAIHLKRDLVNLSPVDAQKRFHEARRQEAEMMSASAS